jgi:membrane-associated protease RseP (regulator of RpoE activity)
MGSSTSSFPDFEPPVREHPAREGSFATHLPQPPQPPDLVFGDPGDFWRREPKRRYLILFALTLLTTTLNGMLISEATVKAVEHPTAANVFRAILGGTWYSIPVLVILGAHEFGHYLACVYYRVNASLPYFIPLPLPPSGTLGAVIRIRQPIPGKRALFDIGIAGPIAGFLMLLPFLFFGVAMSHIGVRPTGMGAGDEFGDPLLLKLVARFLLGPMQENQVLFIHPMGMAAWFGMLATALNLFPIGQLDGGHITYSVFGQRSTAITRVTVGVLMCLTLFVSWTWIVWTGLIVLMLRLFGVRHPPVFDEDIPLDGQRLCLAALGLVMFVLCFTPAPSQQESLAHMLPGILRWMGHLLGLR